MRVIVKFESLVILSSGCCNPTREMF